MKKGPMCSEALEIAVRHLWLNNALMQDDQLYAIPTRTFGKIR